jgi:hypothetical protein
MDDTESTESRSRAVGAQGLHRAIRQLRQRKVCRAAMTYALVLWLNLQIGDVFFPMFGLPEWTLKLVMVIGILGFPVVVLLAWLFQVTPEGIRLDIAPRDGAGDLDRHLDRAVSVLLLVLSFTLTLLLTMQFTDPPNEVSTAPQGGERVTVADERAGSEACPRRGPMEPDGLVRAYRRT